MKYLKLFNESKESLSSLKWEFWNQARHTIDKDSMVEFNKHINLFKKDIDEKIELELKKIWKESRKGDNLSIKDNRDRFNKFINN